MDQVVEKLKYTQEINALEQGIFQDPFAFLGPHQVTKNTYQLKVFLPGATAVSYVGKQSILFEQVEKSALFILTLSAKQFQTDYKLHIDYPLQSVIEEDVYRFWFYHRRTSDVFI